MVVRLVLFDIDGTLIRTGGAGTRAFGHAFASTFGILNGTANLNFAGRTDTSLARELFLAHGVEPTRTNFERFFDQYLFWLDHLLHQLDGAPCPGVEDFIAQIRALRPAPLLGLLTGNLRLGAELKLRRYGLWEHFRTGGFADDHENRDEIAAIARQRGSLHFERELHGEEILVIGDTPLDIRCARAIDARCLAVATGGSDLGELRRHQPRHAVPDLRAVRAETVCR